jgi:hypothetical protein
MHRLRCNYAQHPHLLADMLQAVVDTMSHVVSQTATKKTNELCIIESRDTRCRTEL